MNALRKAPLFLHLCSYFFIFMGIISIGTLAIVLTIPSAVDKVSISFISNSVTYSDHPIVFVGICSLFILAASVGLAIVFKNKYAYDFGVLYSLIAFLFLGSLAIFRIGTVNDPATTVFVLFVVFGGFFTYRFRNRNEWKEC